METEAGERFGDLRVEEALSRGAQALATACPYCIVMLEASTKSLNKEEALPVMDISEVLLSGLE
jgi:Fe-S oxidoreductase